jgi:hypothetical protein
LIACRVLESELAVLTREAPHLVRQEFLALGLHERPAQLRTALADALARAEADPAVEAVVLAYGLCGLATAGLAPRRCPLVIPRAHDCITLLLGSRERYAACMRAEPGTYWFSPGWLRAGRNIGPERDASLLLEYTGRYGAGPAADLVAFERECLAHHTCGAYVDLGLGDHRDDLRQVEHCTQAMGWRYVRHAGDPALLRALLHGPWDEARFLTVQPGARIAHAIDDRIVRAVPLPAGPARPP